MLVKVVLSNLLFQMDCTKSYLDAATGDVMNNPYLSGEEKEVAHNEIEKAHQAVFEAKKTLVKNLSKYNIIHHDTDNITNAH